MMWSSFGSEISAGTCYTSTRSLCQQNPVSGLRQTRCKLHKEYKSLLSTNGMICCWWWWCYFWEILQAVHEVGVAEVT